MRDHDHDHDHDPGYRARMAEAAYRDLHVPQRPAWDCQRCGEPWPCPPLRARLLKAYSTDEANLAQYMASHYYQALDDLPDDDPMDLHHRIIGWIRRSKPIADVHCMGCQPSILSIPHHCGGAAIPSDEVRFRCVCPEPECVRRQGTPATGTTAPVPKRRKPTNRSRRYPTSG
ncbi:hypothetical protein HCA58_02435 [Micromonospora sp. HNM0581]|uniref:hypothetical protein n=1 Tax=Micromonospora sp. HNM0581 TaxID=2716341 RepID=UPI00146C7F72|nr:hypothetical protein [Micromonospora sp. HNM0581]NLU77268.1 hypothetical protein [Micromonospora sp. HNM0581]